MQVDAADYRQVRAAAEGTDAIVNCSVSRRDRRGAFDVNTRGTWNALRAAVEAGHRRFVNTGPRFTLAGPRYLDRDFGIVEEIPPHPGTGLYALSKSLGHEICRLFSEQHPIHLLTLIFSRFCEPHPAGAPQARMNPFARHLPGRGRRGPLRPQGRSRGAAVEMRGVLHHRGPAAGPGTGRQGPAPSRVGAAGRPGGVLAGKAGKLTLRGRPRARGSILLSWRSFRRGSAGCVAALSCAGARPWASLPGARRCPGILSPRRASGCAGVRVNPLWPWA